MTRASTSSTSVLVLEFTAVLDSSAHTAASVGPAVAVPRRAWDWVAANGKKDAAIAALAPLTDIGGDIDARINELAARAQTA